jgi:excisionase family DNA binding protein
MRPERSSSEVSAQAADPPSIIPRPSSYLRVGEAAEILQVSPKTVCRWAMDGKLPFQRTLGGHRRYPEQAIRALAASLQVLPS